MLTFMRGAKLYIGWLGDSQALLVREGTPLQLVDPHKPEREVTSDHVNACMYVCVHHGVCVCMVHGVCVCVICTCVYVCMVYVYVYDLHMTLCVGRAEKD